MSGKDLFLLDCTIRDGGLINQHDFDHSFVRSLFEAVSAAGVDCVELGYICSRDLVPDGRFGPWKFCCSEDLGRVVDKTASRSMVSVMADVGRVRLEEVGPASESPVDMIRVASYVSGIDEAIDMTLDFHGKGYETTINVMAISRESGSALDSALRRINDSSPARTIYIVDSFGALDPRGTEKLVDRFRANLPGKRVGFHGHNNQQLALANTLAAMERGAVALDGTVFGMGRAAGNCPLELLLGRLEDRGADLRPILDLIAKRFLPLKEKVEWGYIIPYALTGLLNRHPREAMELRGSENRDAYRDFYETLLDTGGNEERNG